MTSPATLLLRRPRLLAALVIAIAGATAGCGGDGDDPGTPASSEATAGEAGNGNGGERGNGGTGEGGEDPANREDAGGDAGGEGDGDGNGENGGGGEGGGNGASSATASNQVIFGPAFAGQQVVALGEVAVGGEATTLVAVGNRSGGARTVAGVSITGEHAGDYSLAAGSCDPGSEMPVGGSCELTVTLRPSAPGERRATLVVTVTPPPGATALLLGGVREAGPAAGGTREEAIAPSGGATRTTPDPAPSPDERDGPPASQDDNPTPEDAGGDAGPAAGPPRL